MNREILEKELLRSRLAQLDRIEKKVNDLNVTGWVLLFALGGIFGTLLFHIYGQ